MGAENRREVDSRVGKKIKKKGITDEAETRRILAPPCLSRKTPNFLALRHRKEAPSLKYNYSSLYVTNWQAKLEEC